jgi:hypothetical protein
LVTERQKLVEGLVILAVVLALPKGLAGLGLRRRAARPAAPSPARRRWRGRIVTRGPGSGLD